MSQINLHLLHVEQQALSIMQFWPSTVCQIRVLGKMFSVFMHLWWLWYGYFITVLE